MKLYKKLISLTTTTALLASALPVFAADNVAVDSVVLSRCGQQGVPFSGTVNLTAGQKLAVQLDGVNVPFTLNGSLWITGLIPVSVTNENDFDVAGDHRVIAAILDSSAPDPVNFVLDPSNLNAGNPDSQPSVVELAEMSFGVAACPTPTPTPIATPSPTITPTATPTATPTPVQSTNDGGGNNGGGGGGGGSEEPEPTPKPVVKKSQVKGITKKIVAGTIPNKLVPAVVERLFKAVFGRAIKPFESTYWKLRARTDKVTEALLKGTMQWYKIKGKSVGK